MSRIIATLMVAKGEEPQSSPLHKARASQKRGSSGEGRQTRPRRMTNISEKSQGVVGKHTGRRCGPGNNNLTMLNNFNGRDLLEIKR